MGGHRVPENQQGVGSTKKGGSKEEAMRRKIELRELKRKEVAAKRAAAAAARKTAKAEGNKRARTIKREVGGESCGSQDSQEIRERLAGHVV